MNKYTPVKVAFLGSRTWNKMIAHSFVDGILEIFPKSFCKIHSLPMVLYCTKNFVEEDRVHEPAHVDDIVLPHCVGGFIHFACEEEG